MEALFAMLVRWFERHETFLWALGGVSLLMFVATLVAVPFVIARIPSDYFTRPRRRRYLLQGRYPLLGLLALILKNLLGLILLLAGIAMLVLPGQGLLTILISLTLLNFPGKYRLERWVVERPAVFRSINWIRRRWGVPELEFPSL
ncbi:PGPGW domain-containing protein [Halospina sp. K52047b]|uniref:PGPGW domain-containing protein n=1 Tax=Halospina sp. K52047b TaxID=2614160 RepID=UPI001CE43B7B|nr:PGPGW domain-containing protein [Halospina sp. K52047b]